MTKKVIKNFGGRKSENFVGKGKIGNIFLGVWKFVGNRGKSETGGKCIIASGGWTPLILGRIWYILNIENAVFQKRVNSVVEFCTLYSHVHVW